MNKFELEDRLVGFAVLILNFVKSVETAQMNSDK
jgi:hypothetical protein